MTHRFVAGQALAPGCKDLERYWFGAGAITDACAAPGTWIVVYQVRPLEWVAYKLGIPFRPYRPTKAVVYDKAEHSYHCRDAQSVLGSEACILRGPIPFCGLWDYCPTFDAWLYCASDKLDQAFTVLWRFLRGTLDRLVGVEGSVSQQ